MRRRRSQEDSSPSAPFWMTTYGDMVTNLLVFFVLLFSFSSIDANKWKAIVIGFTGRAGVISTGEGVFDNVGSGINPEDISDESEGETAEEDEVPVDGIDEFEQLYIRIKTYVDQGDLKGQLDLIKYDSEILIRFRDNVIFDSGKAEIRSDAEIVLGDIADVLAAYREEIDMIRIEGHTDNVPIHNARYPSNWELSTARAVEVLRFFIERGALEPRMLSAVGYSEYHPVRENDTEAGRAVNRRVDIVIVKTLDNSQEEVELAT
jgi:chemotaxis protein MotB